MSKLKTIEELETQWSKLKRPKNGQLFEHYKGGQYEIVATGFMEDTEAPCIVYRSIMKNIVFVRTAKNFLEDVEHNGEIRPRFKLISS